MRVLYVFLLSILIGSAFGKPNDKSGSSDEGKGDVSKNNDSLSKEGKTDKTTTEKTDNTLSDHNEDHYMGSTESSNTRTMDNNGLTAEDNIFDVSSRKEKKNLNDENNGGMISKMSNMLKKIGRF
ncbi:uncharacterized protein LOC113004504 [Solenopsis invicta]|uniref:uncharacterized protein LOC113004504 n=1 Tax=Solenopsis invicta TaxID=13686 RepID=UPI000E33F28E|nr:uncharacterized protein LOC113004504 [Solenopsis invicta]